MGPERRVTSTDVARRSGVSRSTVSFVLNDNPSQSIPEATRARVLAAASELGYVRSPAGLALARGRTNTVILDLGVIPFSDYQVGEFSVAFSHHLELAGATVLVHGTGHGDVDELVRLARATQPFAVVSFNPALRTAEDALRKAGVHLVQGIDFSDPGTSREWMLDAAVLQLSHLRATGRTVLGYAVSGSLDPHNAELKKYEVARAEAPVWGMTIQSVFAVGGDRSSTREAVGRWRTEHPNAEGVICYNDNVAFAVLGVLHDLGISVPGTLAVIGTDDIPAAKFAVPALTTLRADVHVGASRLAHSLLTAMGHEVDAPAPAPVFTLVIRDSA